MKKSVDCTLLITKDGGKNEEKKFKLYEYSVRDVRQMLEETGGNFSLEFILNKVCQATGLNKEDIEYLTPSDLEYLFNQFKKANEVFFRIPAYLEQVGLGAILRNYKKNLEKILSENLDQANEENEKK